MDMDVWVGLGWVGLDRIGLDWTGLDWIGLDWTGLDQICLVIVEKDMGWISWWRFDGSWP